MCFIIRKAGVAVRTLLAGLTMLIASTAAHASSVSIELSGGTFGCCFGDSGPVSVAGSINNAVTSQDTASAEANIIGGVLRASAETNAWYSIRIVVRLYPTWHLARRVPPCKPRSATQRPWRIS